MISSRKGARSRIISSVKHAVSETFIIVISEGAPLEITYIFMCPKVSLQRSDATEEGGGGGGRSSRGCPPPTAETIFNRSLKVIANPMYLLFPVRT